MSARSKGFSRWMLFLAGGVLFIGLLIRTWTKQHRFPLLLLIQKTLTKKFGDVEAALLAGKVQQRCEALFSSRPRFHDRRLQIHMDQIILPVLALYQVLLEKDETSSVAMGIVLEFMDDVARTKASFLIRLLQYFPDPFSMLRRTVRLVNRIAFPSSGWAIEYTVDDDKAIAFNIQGCLFVNVLDAYGVPELAQVFCQFDDAIGALFPSQIVWRRADTLARGGKYCDFRYENSSRQAE